MNSGGQEASRPPRNNPAECTACRQLGLMFLKIDPRSVLLYSTSAICASVSAASRSAPVPDSDCTVATRPSCNAAELSPSAKAAVAATNPGLPLVGRRASSVTSAPDDAARARQCARQSSGRLGPPVVQFFPTSLVPQRGRVGGREGERASGRGGRE